MARYAFVAGINQYEHGKLSPLQCAEADARRMANRNNNIGLRVVRVPSP